MQLVADANVLLSAVIGGRAALALRHDKVEQVFTPAAAYDEVLEYLPSLAPTANCRSTWIGDPTSLAGAHAADVAFWHRATGGERLQAVWELAVSGMAHQTPDLPADFVELLAAFGRAEVRHLVMPWSPLISPNRADCCAA